MICLNKWNFFGTLVLIAVIAIAALGTQPTPPVVNPPVSFKEMPRFESEAAMIAAFEKAQAEGRQYGMWDVVKGVAVPMAAPSMATGAESANGGTVDYSTTNIQVEGVDEADIVKSDGKYIYNFSQNRLIITDAYPIENAAILSKTELQNVTPQEMFVAGDKLLLFGYKYEEQDAQSEAKSIAVGEYYPYGGSNKVIARLYDISDRANPKVEKEIEFEGSYVTSRLIGSNAYFVVNSWPRNWVCEDGKEGCIIPLMVEDGVEKKVAEATEIGYIPPMPASSFVTIASLNLETEEMQKETIAGSAETVYASQNSIYLAGTSWLPPETPIVGAVERIITGDREKTVINKFGLQEGKIGYVGQGEVPGHVLNQFSMDEFEGNFRIATTVGQVSRMGSGTTNNLYVLDTEMNTIGKLEDLAPGEKIYSARFMGKRAYMVTFKKVDPLFVIDVSEPTNPKVLGKLKIPGFSDYLHPIDETHLIGVGKETIEAVKGDFAWYQGMKLAVFDVSDVANPIEMHKVVIGDRGTDSYALYDHKAFLYDKEKELLVLPIMLSEIPAEQKKPIENESISPTYGEPVFQGAFVFRLTLENGFEERGRITHVTGEDELKRGYYYSDEYSVKRALYIGNVLYTLSDSMLKANALDTLSELKEFAFE